MVSYRKVVTMNPHPNLARLSAGRLHTRHIISRNLVSLVAIFADILAIALTILLSWQAYSGFILRDAFDNIFFFNHLLTLSGLFVGITFLKWGYRFTSLINENRPYRDVFIAWSLAFITFVGVIFLMKTSANFSRGSVIISFPLGLLLLCFTRRAISKYIIQLTNLGVISPEKLLIIGRDKEVSHFATKLQPWENSHMMYDIMLLPERDITENERAYAYRLKPRLQGLVSEARNQAFTNVFIALPWAEKAAINAAIEELLTLPASLHLAPEAMLERFSEPVIQKIGHVTTLTLARTPLSPVEIALKRLFDMVAGSLIFFIALPFMLAIALLIKLESKGPILFKQWRNGFNQNPFMIYKFRSMTVTEEGAAVRQAEKNDARVTKIGTFIRRWNLDELPQIINVIKGNMSLVGPRPHPLNLDEAEEKRVSLYARRFNIKPGMTGWAQVNGARGSVSDENSMTRRIELDLWYMDNWSLALDIIIMLKTVTSKKAFENAF